MKVNEVAEVLDLAEALENETGTFEATSPQGEIFLVSSKAGHSITEIKHSGYRTNRPWSIRKLSDEVPPKVRTKAAGG